MNSLRTFQTFQIGTSQGLLRTAGALFFLIAVLIAIPATAYAQLAYADVQVDTHTRTGAAKSAGIDLSQLTLTTFDYPGSTRTNAEAINSDGDIVGRYDVAGGVAHGYLRTSDGIFSSYDPPGANGWTSANGLNDDGDIVGTYLGLDNRHHGFLRSNGQFTLFDLGDGLTCGDCTGATGINSDGDIVGNYTLNTIPLHTHGYLKSGGNFTTIDYPGGTTRTSALKINDNGDIVGNYTLSGTRHGYLLKNGNFTSIDYPGAAMTFALGINDDGDIVGGYSLVTLPPPFGILHGFVLSNGQFHGYDVPGATQTTFSAINNDGSIVGRYQSGGTFHGFLLSEGDRGQNGH